MASPAKPAPTRDGQARSSKAQSGQTLSASARPAQEPAAAAEPSSPTRSDHTKPEPRVRRRRAAGLHDRLLGELRHLLTAGELAPGTRIPERLLCERFGVSRTPLREALKVLAAEGYIDLLPNRGARVATVGAEEVRHTFEVMGALEALAGRLAADCIEPAELAEIRALHYQMYAHFLRGETQDYYRLNQKIHEQIVRAARNPVLWAQYDGLTGRVSRQRYRAVMTRSQWEQAMAEHEAMLNALAERRGEDLAAVLTRHLEHKQAVVVGSLEAEGAEAARTAHMPAEPEQARAELAGGESAPAAVNTRGARILALPPRG